MTLTWTSDVRGRLAEAVAALYLIAHGYRLRGARYKTPVGEIDLIATRGRVLVFVEVKFRQDPNQAAMAIHPVSYDRLSRAATHYLAGPGQGLRYDHIRFDLIALSRAGIKHLDNIALSRP